MAPPPVQTNAAPMPLIPGSQYNGHSSYGGRGPEVLIVSWTFCALTLLVFFLRLYTTLFVIRRPRIDLAITSVAVILAVASQAVTNRAIKHGIGQTITKINLLDIFSAEKDVIISVCIGQISLIIGKWGTALLIFQIQGKTAPKLKWILYVALIANTVAGIIASVLMWLGCNHIPDQWQTNPITNPNCPRFRVSNNVSFTYWGISALTDIALSIYPALLFLPLRMSLKRRLGLCVLFSGGLVAAAIAILRIVRTNLLGKNVFIEDLTKESADTVQWAILEIWIVLLLTNIPPLRPLMARVGSEISNSSSALSRLLRLSSRSQNSGPSPKPSAPSDVESQRKSKRRFRNPLSPSMRMKKVVPNSRKKNFPEDSQGFSKFSFGTGAGWSKFSFGFSNTDTTILGSEPGQSRVEKESYEADGSWLADGSDGDSAALMHGRGSVAAPEPAVLPPLPAAQPEARSEMRQIPRSDIAIYRQFDVTDSPRRTEASADVPRIQTSVYAPRPNEPWSA